METHLVYPLGKLVPPTKKLLTVLVVHELHLLLEFLEFYPDGFSKLFVLPFLSE